MDFENLTIGDCLKLQKRNIGVIVHAGEVVGVYRMSGTNDVAAEHESNYKQNNVNERSDTNGY